MDTGKKILAISGAASLGLILIGIILSANFEILGNMIFLSVIVFLVPYSVYKFMQFRKIKAYEAEFPAFLRDLAESQRAGLTIMQAIRLASRSDYGSLSKEIKKMDTRLSWNVPLTKVLASFGRNMTSSKTITRSLMIIEQANKSGGNIEDTMDSLASNIESIRDVQDEKNTLMNQQVIMMYAIFFVFLGISIALIKFLIPMLQTEIQTTSQSLPLLQGGLSSNPCKPCIEGREPTCFACDFFFVVAESFNFGEREQAASYYKALFFVMIVVQGFFSGLIAGQIGSDSITAGVRHSLILLIVGIFTFIIVARLGII